MEVFNKIFLVDDDKFTLNLYHRVVEESIYSEIELFSSGEDCLGSLDKNPTIIFLDYHMGELNGFEVLKKIKANNPNIFVVMVSSQDDLKVAVNSLKNGAFDYIIKGKEEITRMKNVLFRIQELQSIMKEPKSHFFQKMFSFLL